MLRRLLLLSLTLMPLSLIAQSAEFNAAPGFDGPRVRLTTNHGEMVLATNPKDAPLTVKNFLGYVNARHYDGTVFHRVIPGFMIQGGGLTEQLTDKPRGKPISNESSNGQVNLRGRVAMARTMDPNSAVDQFFINLRDNRQLDYQAGNAGFTVFAQVIKGMDVAERIGAQATGAAGRFHADVPLEPVIIQSARVIDAPLSKTTP